MVNCFTPLASTSINKLHLIFTHLLDSNLSTAKCSRFQFQLCTLLVINFTNLYVKFVFSSEKNQVRKNGNGFPKKRKNFFHFFDLFIVDLDFIKLRVQLELMACARMKLSRPINLTVICNHNLKEIL